MAAVLLMAYAKSGPSSEVQKLQEEITREVNTDAQHIARSVFGEAADRPDVGRVSNEQLDQTYRRAYQTNDRAFLQAEARRDPQQFLKVTERLGVQIPPPTASPPPMPAPVAPPPAGVAPMDMLQTILGGGAPAAVGLPAAPVVPGLGPPVVSPSGPI